MEFLSRNLYADKNIGKLADLKVTFLKNGYSHGKDKST